MNQLMLPVIEAQEQFNRYIAALDKTPTSYNIEVASEVQERLEFLFFSIFEITKLAADHMEKHAVHMERMRNGIFDLTVLESSQRIFFRIKFYTESLYMHAFRIMDIMRHKSKPLPGLSSFVCPGVRDVRNHLLVHPEGAASQIFSQSFQWGPDTGSIIKPRREPGELGRHNDLGLVQNMEEFFRNFTRVVVRATDDCAT